MDERWKELIPLYVTGKLSEEQRATLEAVLERSEYARQLVEEWKLIAQDVRDEARIRSLGIPPLSPLIRAEMRAKRNGTPAEQPIQTTTTSFSLSALREKQWQQAGGRPASSAFAWIAAIFIMIFMAGILVWMLNRNDPQQFGSPDNTVIPSEVAALPTAADDLDPHEFETQPDGTYVFSETLSYPDGDRSDQVFMTVLNLAPGEARTLLLTLACTGDGVENVIWQIGNAKVGCGAMIYVGVTAENNQVMFDLYFKEVLMHTSRVSYTLTASSE